MPKAHIFENGQYIAEKTFNQAFYVAKYKDSHVLLWQTFDIDEQDSSPKWQTNHEIPLSAINESRYPEIWISRTPSEITSFHIKCVLPDWVLKINGEECERGFYDEFEIVWSEIALSLFHYDFVFIFRPGDSNAVLPSPALTPPC